MINFGYGYGRCSTRQHWSIGRRADLAIAKASAFPRLDTPICREVQHLHVHTVLQWMCMAQRYQTFLRWMLPWRACPESWIKGSLAPRVLPMVPRQSQSYMYISNAEGFIGTQGTPQWYPGNLNPICTLVMQKGSLAPRVLPNGTQAISILYVH